MYREIIDLIDLSEYQFTEETQNFYENTFKNDKNNRQLYRRYDSNAMKQLIIDSFKNNNIPDSQLADYFVMEHLIYKNNFSPFKLNIKDNRIAEISNSIDLSNYQVDEKKINEIQLLIDDHSYIKLLNEKDVRINNTLMNVYYTLLDYNKQQNLLDKFQIYLVKIHFELFFLILNILEIFKEDRKFFTSTGQIEHLYEIFGSEIFI